MFSLTTAVLAAFFWGAIAVAHAAESLPAFQINANILGQELSRALELKGVIVPLGSPKVDVAVHFGTVRVVSKKIHGLRIGVIPELEVQRMMWRVKSGGSGWSSRVKEFFRREPILAGATFKRFELVFEDVEDFRLVANEGKLQSGSNRLELLGVAMKSSSRRFFFPEARIFLEGTRAGDLEVEDHEGDGLQIKLPPHADIAPAGRVR
jgi:hypothetical protein